MSWAPSAAACWSSRATRSSCSRPGPGARGRRGVLLPRAHPLCPPPRHRGRAGPARRQPRPPRPPWQLPERLRRDPQHRRRPVPRVLAVRPGSQAAAWDDPLPAPTRVPVPDELAPAGTALDGFDLDGAVEVTPPDPAAALARLRWFVERRVDGYARARNSMATDGTSRLSPYLRFGLVSPRQGAAAVTGQGPRSGGGGGRETFVNELLWRDFYAYLLYHRPELAWFELEDDREGLVLAGGAHRLPAGRRRHAPAHRAGVGPQPGPDGGGVVPDQAPAGRLARGPATAPSPDSRRRVPAAAERPHRLSTISPNPSTRPDPSPRLPCQPSAVRPSWSYFGRRPV